MTATKQTELLPCPFCGGDTNASPESQHSPDCYFILMASFRVAAEKNADLSLAPVVTKAWNRRAHTADEPVETVKVVGYLSHCTDAYDPDAPPPHPQEPLMTVAQHNRIMAAHLSKQGGAA